MMKKVFQFMCVMVIVLMNAAFSDRITRYDSDITILEDGTIDVVEKIQVDTQHQMIRLGVTREIPTAYFFMNKRVKTPVNVVSVTRNGEPENFWTENQDGYVEIFTGSVDNAVDNYLDKGEHTFVIHWQSQNHIRSFNDYDELYINAIGHNWRLLIEKSQVTLHLPQSVKAIQSAAYYGRNGETHRGKVIEKSPRDIVFTAPIPLGNGKGLTVATGFTKGIVPSISPNWYDVFMSKILQHTPNFIQPINIILMGMMIVMLLYRQGVRMIFRYRMPKSDRAFMVRFSPPSMFLDEACALYSSMAGQADKSILAIMVSLNAKGIIVIDQENKSFSIVHSQFVVHKNTLSKAEQRFVLNLHNRRQKNITYKQYNSKLASQIKILTAHIQTLVKSFYQKTSSMFVGFGILLLIVMLLGSTVFLKFEIYFALIFILLPMLVIVYPIVRRIYKLIKEGDVVTIVASLLKFVFPITFATAFGAAPLYFMMTESSDLQLTLIEYLFTYAMVWLAIFVIVVVIRSISKIRYQLKKEYVDQHQSLLEFRHFLAYTKEEEYKLITPDLFEEYLPYSIIFGVEKKWLKLYQALYPHNYAVSKAEGSVYISHSHSNYGTFSRAVSEPVSSSRSSGYSSSGGSYSGGGSGSGGGGSSGGGSGGGGGGGR